MGKDGHEPHPYKTKTVENGVVSCIYQDVYLAAHPAESFGIIIGKAYKYREMLCLTEPAR